MELPDDDVGVELMNATFRDLGILTQTPDGYVVAEEFLERITAMVAEAGIPDDPEQPAYREEVLARLGEMGIPAGFEPILANWVIHAVRQERWASED